MTDKLKQQRLRKVLKKTAQPQTGWLDVFPAVIGRANGTVQTGVNGIIYIRNLLNGQVLTVYNFTVPNTAGLQVDVGRKVETPGLWQVKGVREVFSMPAGGVAGTGSHTHDDLFLSRERFLPFLVFPIDGSGFEVQVYGDIILRADGSYASIANQTLDLASYVPTDGTALWVVIEADEDGVLYVNEGTPVASRELLSVADIPMVTDGRVASCAVALYDGQAQLYRDPTSINDFVDLRVLRTQGVALNLDDLLDVNAFEPNDGDVLTYDAFYDMWLAQPPSGGGGGTWGSITGTLADQTDLFSATSGVVQGSISAASSETIADADLLGFLDASDSYTLKKFGFSELKTSLNNQYLKRDSTSTWTQLAVAPSTPAAGFWKVYPKSAGLFILNSAGTETQLGDMLKADNLSGLADAATARTNLGLVAGGAGDIWVEKAGDTMTGQLFIDGSSDQIQLRTQAHSTQTFALQTWESSSGTVLLSVKGNGFIKQDITKNNPTTLEEMHYQIIKLTGTGDYLTLTPFAFSAEANFSTTWNTTFRGIKFSAAAELANSPYSKFSEFTGAHFQASAGRGNNYILAKGGYFEAWNNNGSTITTSIAGDFLNYTETSTTTVTNAIGLRVSFGKANTPTMTTAYGIKVEDVTVSTTNYAIYTGAGDIRLMSSSSNKLGFHGATPVAQQTVTGSRGGNAALADLLTKLANLGLIVDSTSA